MRAIGWPLTDAERDAFIAAARGCANRVRFRHQGRVPATGLDCSGLVVWALQQIPRPVADVRAYGRDPHRDGLKAALIDNLGPAVAGEPQAGDVILMSFAGEPRHVGIIADHPGVGLMLVHSYAMKRKVTEHTFDAEWRGYMTDVFRP